VEESFRETEIHFPTALKKSYEELVAFNKKVTQEPNAALRTRREKLALHGENFQTRKAELDRNHNQRAQLVYLEEQRRQLELAAETARQVREAEWDRGRVVDEIKTMVAKRTPVVERFSTIFNGYYQRVLNHDGIFFFDVNTSNNFDYHIGSSQVSRPPPPASPKEQATRA
jgi:uncharacterized protein YydD (DUF2326 family)